MGNNHVSSINYDLLIVILSGVAGKCYALFFSVAVSCVIMFMYAFVVLYGIEKKQHVFSTFNFEYIND